MEENKMRDVLITINSTQSMGKESDSMELVTAGKYSVDEDGIRLSYAESVLTGMQGTTTSFLVKDDEVVLSRVGSVTSLMVFRMGQKHNFSHNTPYGELNLKLQTLKLEHQLGESGGDMEIEYDIDLDRMVISRNKFKINVREKGN